MTFPNTKISLNQWRPDFSTDSSASISSYEALERLEAVPTEEGSSEEEVTA